MKTFFVGLAVSFALLTSGSALAAGNGRLAITPVSGEGVIVAAVNGQDAHRLCIPAGPCRRVDDPEWSADGRRLVFAVPCGVVDCPPAVVVGTPNGTCVNCDAQQGTEPGTLGFEEYPLSSGGDPSLEGERGLYIAVLGGALHVFTLTGQEHGVLAKGVTAGAVSRQGTIAVVRGGRVWVGAEGHLQRLGVGRQPAWSPRGSELAFVQRGRIVVSRANGGRERYLVAGDDPSWSPNGRQIAYIGAGKQVMEVVVATGRTHRVGDLHGRMVAWGAAPQTVGCRPPVGTQPLTTEAGGTIYQVVAPGIGRTLVGCAASDGISRVFLALGVANENRAYYLEQAAVNGAFAGVVLSIVDRHQEAGAEEVAVYDLRTGEQASALGGMEVPNADDLDDLVINSAGDTAVHEIEPYAPSGTGSSFGTELILAATGMGVQTITTAAANAAGTTLGNLTLNATTLTYTSNGVLQTTQLP
jgi:hypothetical protein